MGIILYGLFLSFLFFWVVSFIPKYRKYWIKYEEDTQKNRIKDRDSVQKDMAYPAEKKISRMYELQFNQVKRQVNEEKNKTSESNAISILISFILMFSSFVVCIIVMSKLINSNGEFYEKEFQIVNIALTIWAYFLAILIAEIKIKL